MYSIYEIKKNESINDIAKKLNLSVEQLEKINGKLENITQGQLIIIPNQKNYDIYIVKKGDTLYSIGKMYDIDVNTLKLFNGLKDDEFLYPNQQIMIPKNKIYITQENDNILKIITNSNMNYDEFFKLNKEILIVPDQIIFFDK